MGGVAILRPVVIYIVTYIFGTTYDIGSWLIATNTKYSILWNSQEAVYQIYRGDLCILALTQLLYDITLKNSIIN